MNFTFRLLHRYTRFYIESLIIELKVIQSKYLKGFNWHRSGVELLDLEVIFYYFIEILIITDHSEVISCDFTDI